MGAAGRGDVLRRGGVSEVVDTKFAPQEREACGEEAEPSAIGQPPREFRQMAEKCGNAVSRDQAQPLDPAMRPGIDTLQPIRDVRNLQTVPLGLR